MRVGDRVKINSTTLNADPWAVGMRGVVTRIYTKEIDDLGIAWIVKLDDIKRHVWCNNVSKEHVNIILPKELFEI